MNAPFRLTARQHEASTLLASLALHILLVGGARSGKTFLIVRAIVIRALRGAGSRHLIARQRFNHVKAAIWQDTLPKVMALCFPDVHYVNHLSDGYLEFANGSTIWFLGLDEKERVDKVLGLEFATIFLNECSQIAFGSVLTVRTRLAQVIAGLRLRAYYDLNPTGSMHWTNREFGQGIDPMTGARLTNPADYVRLFMNPEDNAENLDPATLRMYRALPGKYFKRFYKGEYVPEVDNALWTMDTLAACRRTPAELGLSFIDGRPTDGALSFFKRLVVGVDPSGTKGDEDSRSNEIGIVVAGLGHDGCGYVLDDLTCNLPPKQWGLRVRNAFRSWSADRVIAEINYGGEMVRATIQADDRSVPVRVVTASRGKMVRAEPVAALYEPVLVVPGMPPRGKVYHVGDVDRFAKLEEQMLNFSTAGYEGDKSPDRADANIWALTDLMVNKHTDAPVGDSRAQLAIFAQ